ncbi:MAG TPA: two-component regulator propeller domain-containing protein [Bacteroidota bacterium]|nr:two-component regulator propeller domain-containing protein [Bacteroidota bacterium]
MFVALLFAQQQCRGQTFNFQYYTEREGLPSNLVSAICQDSRGYLWIGTKSGLTLYDGAEFTSYSVIHGLPNNWVTALAERTEDPGTMLVGTIAGGLCEYREGRFRQLTHDGNVNHIHVDRAGSAWFIMNDTLFLLRHDVLRSLAVASVYPDHGGIIERTGSSGTAELVIAFGAELMRFRSDGTRLSSVSYKSFGDIYAIEASPADGTLWMTSADGKICRADASGNLLQMYTLPNREPSTLAADNMGVLWLRTVEGLLPIPSDPSLFDPNAKPFSVEDVLPGHWISPFLFDREDNLWVGTWIKGLLKASDRRVIVYPIHGSHGGVVDSSGNFWVTTDSTIVQLTRTDNGIWRKTIHSPRPNLSWEGEPAIDARGRIWLVANQNGKKEYSAFNAVNRTEQNTRLMFSTSMVLPHDIAAWFVDRDNHYWVPVGDSALEIIDVASKSRLRTLRPNDGLAHGGAKVFFQDHSGVVWIGLWNNGLVRCSLTPDVHGTVNFRSFTSKDGLPYEGIRALHEDSRGTLWIGTRHGGLARLDANGRIATVSMTNGLRSNTVWKITSDQQGRIWLITDAGVECVESATLKPLAVQNKLTGQEPLSMGVYRNEFLWLVAPEGISIFEFNRPATALPPPLVHISSVRVNDAPRPMNGIEHLTYDENHCTITYSGLGLRDEHNLRFRYRLLGLDSAWGAPVSQRAITYAALDPGEYAFEVVAITADGVPSAAPARLHFWITPPVYQRWWFLTLAAAVAAVVLWMLYRYRVNRLLELERLRTRIASDLHDDVGTNLGSIIVTSQLLERRTATSLSGNDREQIREIGAVAQNTQEMMRDIVWMLNPSNDHIEDLVLKMKEVAARLLPGQPCEFNVSAAKLSRQTSIDFKRNVFLVFKEALHNTVRHSSATQVIVDLHTENGSFTLQVRDNGNGFDPSVVKRGNGLSNMQRRAAQLKGLVTVESSPGNGTTVRLTIENHAIT